MLSGEAGGSACPVCLSSSTKGQSGSALSRFDVEFEAVWKTCYSTLGFPFLGIANCVST